MCCRGCSKCTEEWGKLDLSSSLSTQANKLQTKYCLTYLFLLSCYFCYYCYCLSHQSTVVWQGYRISSFLFFWVVCLWFGTFVWIFGHDLWPVFLGSCFLSQRTHCKQMWMIKQACKAMFYSTPLFLQGQHYSIMFTSCACVSTYCIQVKLFILVALLANVFPHLNTTPPILFISHICGRWRVKWQAGKGVRETERCVYVHEHTLRQSDENWCQLMM